MDTVPTLQVYCYNILARYSGYIEDFGAVSEDAILEICARSEAFGLVNLEEVVRERETMIDLNQFWKEMYDRKKKENAGYLVSDVRIM